VDRQLGYCQSCRRYSPIDYLSFHQIIGVIFVRFTNRVEGNLCANCSEYYFWRFTMITLFLGWWSFTSLFLTPIILSSNFWNYMRSIKLRDNSAGEALLPTSWKMVFLSGFVLILFLIFSLYSIISGIPTSENVTNPNHKEASGYQATQTKSLMTNIPTYQTRTIVNPIPTQKPNTNCVSWAEVSISDKGRKMCVYGVVRDAYFGEDYKIFYITFSHNVNAFRFIASNGRYFEGVKNKCIEAEGIIKTYGKMPYIEIVDRLKYCSNSP
jgi:hypothetical protein